jgi:hypothetical protein
LATERRLLVVIDGAKALHKAVMETFGERAQIQVCSTHFPQGRRISRSPKARHGADAQDVAIKLAHELKTEAEPPKSLSSRYSISTMDRTFPSNDVVEIADLGYVQRNSLQENDSMPV